MASTEQSNEGPLTVRSGRVKHARRLATRAFRDKTGEFLAEGPQAVREALAAGAVIEVFATSKYDDWRDDAVTWNVVDDDLLGEIADAVTPQGIVARCRSVVGTLDDLPAEAGFVVVCADVRDPGNAGAVIRCADAAGADAVILAGDSVDPLNPKAVRAGVGSLFHLPVVVDGDVAAVIALLRERGLRVLAADGHGELDLFDPAVDLVPPTAWLFGNEAWGLPEDVRDLADAVVAVPIFGRAESLNLATAAAVCLYATAWARRRDPEVDVRN
ncbi:TrmH family RNA methyltransferase [Aeromicrobium terrae]|uniref:TrmH family RNA methyltransferase n=1 Tax=Aeromicrobium terrae TaxID=2498846 RepID=UPI0016504829|nr:RNA methyltransferase [Aeromicrobium terrae]